MLRAGSDETVRTLVIVVQSGVDLSQVAAHVRNAVRSEQAIQVVYDETTLHIDGQQDLPSATAIFNLSASSESPPELTSLRNEARIPPSEAQSNSPTEITRGSYRTLSDPPVRVPAKPWTTVTDDDYLVSHLVSIWLTWMHPWWQWVDKDNFVEAMQQKDITSPLCTTCIVNMILADACVSTKSISRFNTNYHSCSMLDKTEIQPVWS